jgi:hypothetical protein
MTTFTAAPTHHQGYDFVAVLVKDPVLMNPHLRDEALEAAGRLFGRDPVLIGERNHHTYGAQRAVNMMRKINVLQLPWQEYRFT